MSVLKNKRKENHVEYIGVAYTIFVNTSEFITKLSARYSRIISGNATDVAFSLIRNVESANATYPCDEISAKLREEYLLKARADLRSLDVLLSFVYEILMKNPAGAFKSSTNKDVDSKTATKKLDNMAQELGELIDKECAMLNALIKKERAVVRKEQEK